MNEQKKNEQKKNEQKKDEQWDEVEQAEVKKLETENDYIVGYFVDIEKSRKFPKSFALRYKESGKLRVVFVNNIVDDLIKTVKLNEGDKFKLVYTGLKSSDDESGNEYKTFKLYVSK